MHGHVDAVRFGGDRHYRSSGDGGTIHGEPTTAVAAIGIAPVIGPIIPSGTTEALAVGPDASIW
jgi:hypothetical protein